MRLGTLVGIVAAIIVLGALWSVTRQATRPPVPPLPPPSTVPDTLESDGETLISRALGQIPEDSTAIKMRWMDEIANVDLGGLSGDRLERFVRHANARRCTCGCGYTLAACRAYDPTCPVSGPILESLRDSILTGRVRNANGLRKRPERADTPHGG